ncbi:MULTISPECIES: hypothetical protein [unclassified Lentimonas]|uniref:hypothetical protein n=1 Tax=unclassified Lentimonas TaxID=2630993 RepID=UPI00132A3349|nr:MULTISPECIES: hypothetical protein [unclassified Lentimonas]CAA6696754.1 Unannotated [Lentimonas sp. CC10]CAA6697291.1 Unannotated [Lentimonas sp. CC19]CAA7072275.1 Unannotated [Lentimonas sp. CC11]
MPPSFEELANEGIPADAMPPHGSHRSKPLIIAASLTCILALGYHFLSDPALPEAAEILLAVDGEVPGVLPHAIDSSTEFNESFETLKEGEGAPNYRETDEGKLSTPPTVIAKLEPSPTPQPVIPEQPITIAASAIALEIPLQAKTTAQAEPESTPTTALHLPKEAQVEFPRDWGGIVLVPDGTKLAKAYTSDVRLARVEAHPIDGERIRVWARIQNLTEMDMQSEVGCEFRSSNYEKFGSAHFEPSIIPKNGVIDVYFESPYDRVESYTVMVKRVQ